MNNERISVNINSFNCRGLRKKQKREGVFKWLKSNHMGISMLQETHSTTKDEEIWEREWEGKIYFSHWDFNARGVAILIPNEIENSFKFENGIKDKDGRFLLLSCLVENNHLILVNVYCPTKDNHAAQLSFIENIRPKIEEFGDKNIILGGDLNTYIDIKRDKKGG